jgi:hypothetical protein
MRAPHRSPDLLGIDDASVSVAAAPRPHIPATRRSLLTNKLRLDRVRPNVLVIGPVPRVEAAVSTIVATSLTSVCYWTLDVPLSTLGAERTVVITGSDLIGPGPIAGIVIRNSCWRTKHS